MAQITAHGIDEMKLERLRSDRLRSFVPVAIAVIALLGIVVGAAAFAASTVLDFGSWFVAG